MLHSTLRLSLRVSNRVGIYWGGIVHYHVGRSHNRHKAFLRWPRAQDRNLDMPSIHKNAPGSVGITLKRGAVGTLPFRWGLDPGGTASWDSRKTGLSARDMNAGFSILRSGSFHRLPPSQNTPDLISVPANRASRSASRPSRRVDSVQSLFRFRAYNLGTVEIILQVGRNVQKTVSVGNFQELSRTRIMYLPVCGVKKTTSKLIWF